jgi:hypothetical protein
MSRNWKWFSQEEIAAWPKNHKVCRKCFEVKPFSFFHKNDNGKQLFGLSSDCKECRKAKSKSDWQKNKTNIKKNILQRSKSRAKAKGIPFNLSEDDIVIPDMCPVFGKPFILNDREWTYSLDRIIPELGYVKGNVLIVSNKANNIKSDARPEDIIAVGTFYQNLIK